MAPLVFFILTLSSCASLKFDKAQEAELKKNEEFEQAVTIVKPAPPAEEGEEGKEGKKEEAASAVKAPTTSSAPSSAKGVKKEIPPSTAPKKAAKKTPPKTAKKDTKAASPAAPLLRQPDIEDTEGFAPGSRRPQVDPFRVGEEVVHDVHYFKVSAGELRLKVEPFSFVNNRKSYTFAIEIKTSSLFNAFYSVDDRVETFVDFEDLIPRVFQLHVRESKQVREAKMLFDTDKNVAKFWEKKITTEDGEEEKRQEWEIEPYAQNIYSAAFYMRNFKWETGQEYSFRVANDNENLVFSGKALRREVLDTKLGPMKAIVIRPDIVLKGKFKPIGENLIWLSDDDRKYILRIEAKIKIGTLVSEVIAIKPGKP